MGIPEAVSRRTENCQEKANWKANKLESKELLKSIKKL